MSLSFVLTAGVVAAGAAIVWRRWVRGMPREQGLDELLESSRRQLDTALSFRPLRSTDGTWAAVLDAAMSQVADIAPTLVQLDDIAATSEARIDSAMRPLLSSDGKMVVFITCAEGLPPIVGVASYGFDARYLTVRAEHWLARSPISRVRLVTADALMLELLEAHRVHTAAEALVRVSSTDDFVQQLERMEHLELAWRRAQPEEDLFDRDLIALLGDKYDEFHGRVNQRSLPQASAAILARTRRRS